MNIGIFSGSFNPIHVGHLALANYLCEFEGLDELWFLVTPRNPFKQGQKLLPDALRLELVRVAISGYSRFRASDFEFRLPQPSYTIHTLDKLKEVYPQHTFHLIIGSDNWAIFDRWKSAEEIIRQFRLYIYPRPGYEVDATTLPSRVHLTQAPMMEISSTGIRALIANGQSTAGLLPQPVEKYIKEHKLYTHILK